MPFRFQKRKTFSFVKTVSITNFCLIKAKIAQPYNKKANLDVEPLHKHTQKDFRNYSVQQDSNSSFQMKKELQAIENYFSVNLTWRGRRNGLILSMVSITSAGIQQSVNERTMVATALDTDTSS